MQKSTWPPGNRRLCFYLAMFPKSHHKSISHLDGLSWRWPMYNLPDKSDFDLLLGNGAEEVKRYAASVDIRATFTARVENSHADKEERAYRSAATPAHDSRNQTSRPLSSSFHQ